MTTADIHTLVQADAFLTAIRLGDRAIREVVTDLETMGLVKTWLDARGRGSRVK